MRAWLSLCLVLGCGASTGLTTAGDAGVPDAPSCLPPCLARAFNECSPPTGACVAYITAAVDNWRRCFANGLRVEAQPMGGHRYRSDRGVCASVSTVAAATVNVDTWRDGAGTVIATATRPYTSEAWTITCDGAEYVVDPSSAACTSDPWVRGRNPHALPCPIGPGSDACRTQ